MSSGQRTFALVCNNPGRAETFESMSRTLSWRLGGIIGDQRSLLKRVSRANADAVVIDADEIGAALLAGLLMLMEHKPMPVLLYDHGLSLQSLNESIQAGVCQVVNAGITPETFLVGMAAAEFQFDARNRLALELEEAKDELSNRKCIDRAKYQVMEAFALSERQAYEYLRTEAMNRGISLAVLADRILQQADSAAP